MRRKAHSANDLDRAEDPAWLLAPPDGEAPPPPVSTREQVLPFDQLGWRDFERLCLRLARLEGDAEHWQLYGTAGQEQGGIDVYVRRSDSDKYTVWQSKRHRTFRPSDIQKAVRMFLEGDWAERTDRFVLCTSASLDDTRHADAIEQQAAILRKRGIVFEVLDAGLLSQTLKTKPEVVDDFFDRAWTERFCGQDAAHALGAKLGRMRMTDLRLGLLELYGHVFASADPGVLRAASGLATPPKALPLARRFVLPDLSAPTDPALDASPTGAEPRHEEVEDEGTRWSRRRPPIRRRRRASGSADLKRTGLEQWAASVTNAVVLGEPGSGKSTLLRFLALDMLSPAPRLAQLRRRWPSHLPVLLPFAFWTRLISTRPAGLETSVPGAARAWLEQLSASRMAAHVGKAFEDGRVLLLVDGVDEWTDETAAGSALTILHAFASLTGIPTIVTSRPHGARVLGALDASWTRHSLAPLAERQKRDFAQAWFEWLDDAEGRHDGNGQASARAEAFLVALSRAPQVAALSGTPLLLGGLIAIAREGGALPNSRLEAYGELVGRVLDSHPRSRSRAALTPVGPQEMDPGDRRRALAALAFEMQRGRQPGAGVDGLRTSVATVAVRDFLAEELDLPADRARERARQLVEVGADALGILVERGPGEIGFLHRAFQELLAAEHIAGLELDDQLALVTASATDPQWRDVLLFTVQLARRASDVERLVEALESAIAPLGSGAARDLLLAEIAFGAVRRTPALTRRLTARFLDEVEFGDGEAERYEVMRLAVGGLLSEQTAGHVAPRLRRWFPNHQIYSIADALRMTTDWPETEVDDVLLRAFEADEEATRRQASITLASRRGGDEVWADRLLEMVRRPSSIDTAASAAQCLAFGWPDRQDVVDLLDAAAASPNRQLAFVGIEARIARSEQTDAERDRLLSGMDSFFTDGSRAAASLLATGWPNDPVLKAFVLDRLGEPGFAFSDVRRLAWRAFPRDQEVAARIVQEFSGPSGRSDLREMFDALAVGYAGDEALADALVAADRRDRPYVLAHAAKIARTPAIRSGLLETMLAPDLLTFWAVGALIEHWPDDPEVRPALAEVLEWEPRMLSLVAEHVPWIAEDEHRARSLLIDLARAGVAAGGQDLIGPMNTLVTMRWIDDELVRTLVDAAGGALPDDDHAADLVIAAAQAAPGDPRLHEIVRPWLRRSSNIAGVMALLLGGHASMRAAVLECCAPLPQALRTELAMDLSEVAVRSNDALTALAEGRGDGDRAIASDATVLYATALHIRGEVDAPLLQSLESDLQAKGSWLDNSRIAALASLVALRRVDLVRSGANARDELKVGLGRYSFETDGPILRAMANAWAEVQTLLDCGTTWLEIQDRDLVVLLAPFAEAQPSLAEAVKSAAVRSLESSAAPVAALVPLVEDPDTSRRATDVLIGLLNDNTEWAGMETSLAAAAVLSRRLSGRSDVGRKIETRLSEGIVNGPVAALCDGWPLSAALKEWFDKAKNDSSAYETMGFPIRMKVIATLSPADVLVRNLEYIPDKLQGDVQEGMPYWTETIRRRLSSDREAYSLALETMKGTKSVGARISLASLLVQARGLTAELRDWIVAEASRDAVLGLGDIGMDVSLGYHVVTRRRLVELMNMGGASG